MKTLEFAQRHLGQVVTAPGGDGGECVDLANLFLLEVHDRAHIYRDAVDWATLRMPGVGWAANAPANYPTLGQLVVWGPYAPEGIGSKGHIAVCIAADPNVMVTLDQNWPEGAPVALRIHGYGGVLGWHLLGGG